MKTLKNKLIATGALLTGLGFGSGCAGLATAIYEDSPFGEIDMARQRARAPKIVINEGRKERTTAINKQEFISSIKSYKWDDKNMNDKLDVYNEEISKESMSDIFKESESIAFLFAYKPFDYLNGKDLIFKVFDSNNNLVTKFKKENIEFSGNPEKIPIGVFTIQNLKKGKYISEFYSENKLLGIHTFRIEE